jgi:hypothetical protein
VLSQSASQLVDRLGSTGAAVGADSHASAAAAAAAAAAVGPVKLDHGALPALKTAAAAAAHTASSALSMFDAVLAHSGAAAAAAAAAVVSVAEHAAQHCPPAVAVTVAGLGQPAFIAALGVERGEEIDRGKEGGRG